MKKIINIALACVLLVVVGELALRALHRSTAKSDRARIETEAKKIFAEYSGYFETHGEFPDAGHSSPLEQLGSYNGSVAKMLLRGRPDGYDSPDDQETNGEFWMELTSSADPAFRIVIARSDDAPSAAGRWLDGVYLCQVGEVTKL